MSETNEIPEWAWECARMMLAKWCERFDVDYIDVEPCDIRELAMNLDSIYARGREEAAKVCDGLAEGRWREPDVFDDERYAARECAAAIRAGGA